MSVLPLTSSIACDTISLNDGVVAAAVTAQGGSGSYGCQWQLSDSMGTVIGTGSTNQLSQNLLPGNYTVTFTVNDLVSGESETHTWAAAVPVRFMNVQRPETTFRLWTTVMADVALSSGKTLTFTVDYNAPASAAPHPFKVTIGDQTYYYSGAGTDSIQQYCAAGTTTVAISMQNAGQGEASLTITSAGGLAIGTPDTITFEMGTD